jgi:hypothetical protein
MGQLSLFSRAETAAMRDRTKARNYDPERDEFRRQQRFRRDWGLQRRHAEKLRRLRESGAMSRPPSVRASGQVRPVTCASRPTHRGPAPRQAAPAKAATRPSAPRLPAARPSAPRLPVTRPSAPRLPVTRPSAPRPSAARPSAPHPLEVPVSPRATLPSGGSRPPLPVLPAWDRPVLAGLRKAGPSPHAADSSAPSSAGIWPPSSGSFTLVIIAESARLPAWGAGHRKAGSCIRTFRRRGRSDACIVADISESKTLGQLTQNCECADRDGSRRLWNRAGPPFWSGADPPERGRLGGAGGFALYTDTDPQLALYGGTGQHPRAAHGHGPTPSPPHGHRVGAPRTRPTPSPRHGPTRSRAEASPRTRADRHGPAPPHGHEPTRSRADASPRTRADAVTGRRLRTHTSRRTGTGAFPRTRACALALHTDRARHLHRNGRAPSTDTGRRPHPDTGRRGHGPTSPTDTGRRAHPAQRHRSAPSPSVAAGGRRDLLIKREASILQIKPRASISVRTRPVTRSACGRRGDACSRITSACCGRGDPPRRG